MLDTPLTDRHKKILSVLNDVGGSVSSTELCRHFDVSIQTIRKDLNALSEWGLVKRIHGGITRPVAKRNLSFERRQVIHLTRKRAIARAVVKQLPVHSSVFLGIGTTPEQVAIALKYHEGLTVVTNNMNAALALCENPKITTHVTGGLLRHNDQDLMGENTLNFLNQFKVDIGIFGVGGISEQGDLLDFSVAESHVSKAIIQNSQSVWLIADGSKYQRAALVNTAHLSTVDCFYTDAPNEPLQTLCQQYDIPFHVARTGWRDEPNHGIHHKAGEQ